MTKIEVSSETLTRKINWNDLFKYLRDRYMTQTGKTSNQIAEEVKERPQCMSTWATGFGGRKPPQRLILWFLEKTETELAIKQGTIYLNDLDGNPLESFTTEKPEGV